MKENLFAFGLAVFGSVGAHASCEDDLAQANEAMLAAGPYRQVIQVARADNGPGQTIATRIHDVVPPNRFRRWLITPDGGESQSIVIGDRLWGTEKDGSWKEDTTSSIQVLAQAFLNHSWGIGQVEPGVTCSPEIDATGNRILKLHWLKKQSETTAFVDETSHLVLRQVFVSMDDEGKPKYTEESSFRQNPMLVIEQPPP